MIYLQNTSEESQVVFVPRNGANPGGDLVFKAKNTINLDEEIDLHVSDLQISDIYMYLAVTLPEGLPNGEYEYTLLSDDALVSTGLLVIGENFSPSQHNKEIVYEQYTTE